MIHEDVLDTDWWLLVAVQRCVATFDEYARRHGNMPDADFLLSDDNFRFSWGNLLTDGAINGADSMASDIEALRLYLQRRNMM
jgi:hypothetical protein